MKKHPFVKENCHMVYYVGVYAKINQPDISSIKVKDGIIDLSAIPHNLAYNSPFFKTKDEALDFQNKLIDENKWLIPFSVSYIPNNKFVDKPFYLLSDMLRYVVTDENKQEVIAEVYIGIRTLEEHSMELITDKVINPIKKTLTLFQKINKTKDGKNTCRKKCSK